MYKCIYCLKERFGDFKQYFFNPSNNLNEYLLFKNGFFIFKQYFFQLSIHF